ncbi:MAG TPA: Ig-like domain-containing protein [Gemmatimonadales bacterium]|nr:Ig-like domain-containing protein [Gemmatimonadales bacterium]
MPASSQLPSRRTRASLRVPLALATALSCLTCETPIPLLPAARGDRVVAVAVVPRAVSLNPGDTQAFSALGVTGGGDSIPGAPVEWEATGGAITPDGIYTAGSGGGNFSVTAVSLMGTAQSGIATVNVFRNVIAAIAVRPDTATLPLKGSWRLYATVFDSVGDSVSAGTLAWTSSNPAVVLVDSTGLVTGESQGTATITATEQGKTGSAVVTVVPPGTGPWTHEPAGLSVISDQPWDAVTSLGWSLQFGVMPLIVADPSAPLSPPDVLQITYPIGFASGSAPSTVIHSLPGTKQLYVGMWWKPSNPWQGNDSNANKIQYVFTNGSGSVFMVMYGPRGGPYELRVFPQFNTSSDVWLTPNVMNVPVTLGQWHKIEWLLVYNTTTSPPNGICRWWLDGQLLGDYYNVQFPSEPLAFYKVAPVFGGNGGPKVETDYYWYDHVHLSGR